MARSFTTASSQALTSPTLALSSYNQASIALWLNIPSFNNLDGLASEYSANSNINAGTWFIDPNAGAPASGLFEFQVSGGTSSQTSAVSFTRPSAATLHQYVFEIDFTQTQAAQIPVIYVDGVSQSLSVVGGNTSTSGSFGNYALYFMSRAASSLFCTGTLADFAIWASNSGNRGGALLTAGEALALFQGAKPRDIRPTSLTYWWDIDGLQSPEPDYGGSAANLTLNNAPLLAAGPPVMQFTPRWPQTPLFVPPPFVPWAQSAM